MTPRILTPEQQATVRDEILEIESYLAGVRGQLDDLWHAARDATEAAPMFTTESNRRSADDAAFEALQQIRAIEAHLEKLGGQL